MAYTVVKQIRDTMLYQLEPRKPIQGNMVAMLSNMRAVAVYERGMKTRPTPKSPLQDLQTKNDLQ